MNLMIELINCMVCVQTTGNTNSLTQCFRCISRDFLLEVTVKYKQLGLLVETFPNLSFTFMYTWFMKNLE